MRSNNLFPWCLTEEPDAYLSLGKQSAHLDFSLRCKFDKLTRVDRKQKKPYGNKSTRDNASFSELHFVGLLNQIAI